MCRLQKKFQEYGRLIESRSRLLSLGGDCRSCGDDGDLGSRVAVGDADLEDDREEEGEVTVVVAG